MKTEKERIAELIGRIKEGDKTAFDELYKMTSSRAYFIALQITKNEHDAEDILQESYIKTLEKIEDIDPENNFAGWFYQVVANKSKDFLKSKKLLVFSGEEEENIESFPDETIEFNPEENLDQEELREEVMAAIDELTAEKRTCLMMMYFGEMSVNEIAESLEVPVSTVKNRLCTARKDLKNKFEKKGITSLYSAAPLGVVIWALGKTSEAVSATFAASAASAAVLSGVTATAANGIAVASAGSAATTAATATATSTAAAAGAAGSAATTAAATGTGVAAKIAVMSVAQKVVAGVVTVSVVGGSSAGVATVVKHNHEKHDRHTTTSYVYEVTTAPSLEYEFVFAESTTEQGTTQMLTTEQTTRRNKREPTATTAEHTETRPPETEHDEESSATRPVRKTTTRRNYFPDKSTTQTTALSAATTATTATTTKVTTTRETTTEEATQAPETTEATTVTTAQATTQPTTAAPATAVIKILDMNDDVVETLTLTVPAETEMTWDYLIALISANGYEATAGVYGDAVGAVAESGATYNFEAEL